LIADESDTLGAVPPAVAEALTRESLLKEAAEGIAPMSKAVVLGRGHNHATAFEWAIKMQEMAYVLAHPYSTADFAHGPFALLEPGFPVLAVISEGALAEDGLELLRRAHKETGASITVLTNARIPDLPTIDLPTVDEWLSPMMFIAAAQLFTLHTAIANGVDPETPRGLIKVTKTS
jgi:glucosamine--fructose-6-phosphate aminotransferase (isomerizing)